VPADVLTITVPKDLRGLLYTDNKTRPLAKGAYCAKAGGCKCKTQTNLQLPQLKVFSYCGANSAYKDTTVTFEGRKLKDYCNKPKPGPGPGGDSCPVNG